MNFVMKLYAGHHHLLCTQGSLLSSPLTGCINPTLQAVSKRHSTSAEALQVAKSMQVRQHD